MDIGQMPRYRFVDNCNDENNIVKRPYHHARWEGRARIGKQSTRNENGEESSETKTSLSPPRTPRVVKSLVSGSINYSEQPTTTNKLYTSLPNNHSDENVVIDKLYQQNTKQAKPNAAARELETKTSLSFLSSIGACRGVGKVVSSFQNEHKEEIPFTYRLEDFQVLASRRHLHDEAKKNEKYEMISELSNPPTLSRARTCTTSNTAVPSSMILDTGGNSVMVGSIGTGNSSSKGVTLNSNHVPPRHTFSSARKLLYPLLLA